MGESTKRCCTCQATRPLSDFSRNRRVRDGLQNRCRNCWRVWYENNREQHIVDVGRRNAAACAAHQARLTEYLRNNPCVDCGEDDVRVLEFDHEEPEAKTADVARLASMNIAWERVEAEIAKCSVRCANCHRRRTAEMFGYWRAGVERDRRAASAGRARARLESLCLPRR